MSLLVNHQPWKLCFRKTVLVRSSPLNFNGVSSSLPQTPPCYIWGANPCGEDLGKLRIMNANERRLMTPNERSITNSEKKVPLELMKESVTIGASHGWVATLKKTEH
ncbi:unnamed protein product [Arabis nemorensis]|uniref:Uncharacterized protein n=1 Tax=Arabis nemorensis TaxID=586526 RepID=A0A565AMV8_9BRAS|nr:unnamed protein product [Arabis nemorensis]